MMVMTLNCFFFFIGTSVLDRNCIIHYTSVSVVFRVIFLKSCDLCMCLYMFYAGYRMYTQINIF